MTLNLAWGNEIDMLPQANKSSCEHQVTLAMGQSRGQSLPLDEHCESILVSCKNVMKDYS